MNKILSKKIFFFKFLIQCYSDIFLNLHNSACWHHDSDDDGDDVDDDGDDGGIGVDNDGDDGGGGWGKVIIR